MLEKGKKAVRLIISGRVQGVWFRDWTVQNARALSLDGWVRNRADGTVEALLVGTKANVDDMIDKCWKGSDAARVDHIEVNKAKGIVASGFKQKPTVDLCESRNF